MENHKEKLRMVIEEYWVKELPDVKSRLTKLKLGSDLINDVIGPRRAGKTYLMFLTITKLLEGGLDKKATIYINFENRKLLPLTPGYFNDFIEFIYALRLLETGEKNFVFLDEVQRVAGWEKYVRGIYDEFKGKIKLFVSGSTSELTGSEPEVVLTESNKEELVQTLFTDIISRDILTKLSKNRAIVDEVAYFLCSNIGKLVSFSKLSGTLNARGIKISLPWSY